jgi:hypothetical protein
MTGMQRKLAMETMQLTHRQMIYKNVHMTDEKKYFTAFSDLGHSTQTGIELNIRYVIV